MELVGYEDDEARSPLVLDDGWFKYVADDGMEFDIEQECLDYERELALYIKTRRVIKCQLAWLINNL